MVNPLYKPHSWIKRSPFFEECYPMTLDDLDGELLSIVEVIQIHRNAATWLYSDDANYVRLVWLFDRMHGWFSKPYYPHPGSFTILVTTSGNFILSSAKDSKQGVWVVDVSPEGDPVVTGTARLIPNRKDPMLTVTNEATGKCALEFGIYSRTDDDPNMRTSRPHFNWDPEHGFDSKYLVAEEEPEVQPVVVHGKSNKYGEGSTPKHVGAGTRGARKNGRGRRWH